jgi:beta-lactamase regulating signal transducer with metallopeptidase domain
VIVILADTAVRAAALAGVVALLLWMVRVRSAALRLRIWRVGLVASCLVPLWTSVAPSFARFEVARSFELPQTWTAPQPVATLVVPAAIATDRAGIPAPTVPMPRPALPDVLARIYWVGVAVLALRAAAGWVSSSRLRRRLSPVRPEDAAAYSEELSLFESPDVCVPLTVGVLAPRIVLPAGWREWPAGKIAMAIAHERAHVARRDAITLRLALLYRTVFWFSPVSWWWVRHLRALAEQAADESALAETRMAPDTYAAFLLEFYEAVAGSGRRARWHLAMAAGRVQYVRVQRILEWTPERARHTRVVSVTLLGLVILAAGASASIVTSSPLRATRPPMVLQVIQTPSGWRASPADPPPAPAPRRPRAGAPEPPALLVTLPADPAPVNFAGVWVPVDPSRASALFDVGLAETPETGMTMTQDDKTLTMTGLHTGDLKRSLIAPQFFGRTVYRLDGAAVLDGSTSESSAVRWQGPSLVIVTTGPRGSRRTVLSLEGDQLRMQVDVTPPQGAPVSVVTVYKRRPHGERLTPQLYLPVRARPGGIAKTICGLTVIEQSPDLDAKILMPPDPRGGAAIRRIEPQACTAGSGR